MSTQDMSLAELFRRFPDDAAAERWFEAQHWPQGRFCPRLRLHQYGRGQGAPPHALPLPRLPRGIPRYARAFSGNPIIHWP